ncbi:MAG TPA: alpha/beta hydrolase [Solirubrobacterales bacterium]|nr:alpha/beta hydrolase [Solirubrobacterales bacterium]
MRRRELEVWIGDRRLLAQEAGPEDGDLVLHHEGTPGSRHIFDGYIEAGAERGLRHVTCSRPGYEGSDRQPGRCFADAAVDSAALADALGVESFYTVGVSGGGGPALACAALLPDRVRAAASVSALGPREGVGPEWLADAANENQEEFDLVGKDDAGLEAKIRETAEAWSEIRTVEQLMANLDSYLCEADRNLSSALRAHQVWGCGRIDADEIWGWFDDDWAMCKDWGFDLDQITVPVTIWQGGKDLMVPPQNGKWLAANVPGAKLKFFPEEGHLSMIDRHYGEILDDLVASAGDL